MDVIVVAGSGTCTDSGKGEVGSGFCDANALVPKLARVGVVAPARCFGGGVGAVFGLGVIGDVALPWLVGPTARSGWLTGRNAAAMVKAYGEGLCML